ncbi:aminoglycoside phosphotransferase family protein, partial [Nonomuraea sp. KC401]|uniref:phosphotransferase n=1 Tax=Nonomuraea sp. KC401 TaxID=1848324 RepID=UPI00126BD8BC
MPAPEEPLHGGHNATEVVRVGDTVRRARDSNAAFAARVLRHLESAGYPYAPRHLGIDERGRDVLGFITGATTDHPAQRAPGAYARGGRMLRELHEATAGHMLAAGRECVVHGDPGPFNTVFRDGLPVAFIDWSSCRPGDRLDPAP